MLTTCYILDKLLCLWIFYHHFNCFLYPVIGHLVQHFAPFTLRTSLQTLILVYTVIQPGFGVCHVFSMLSFGLCILNFLFPPTLRPCPSYLIFRFTFTIHLYVVSVRIHTLCHNVLLVPFSLVLYCTV